MAKQSLAAVQPRAVKRGQELMKLAKEFAQKSKSKNTIRMYRAAFKDFCVFCEEQGMSPLPADPQVVIMYLAFIKQQSISTIQLKLAAITEAHRMAHLPDPAVDEDVKTVMAGIRRMLRKPIVKKKPLLREHLTQIVAVLPDTLRGKRDKALLLMDFAGAFRRSELVALRIDDLRFMAKELIVTVRQSKTDQTGVGMEKHIPIMADKSLCPVSALRIWLREAKITSGPIFRKVDKWSHPGKTALDAQSVALIVKAAVAAIGLDPTKYSGHSARSGFVTSAYLAKAPEHAIMAQTGHRSVTTVRSYNQDKGEGASEAARAALGE